MLWRSHRSSIATGNFPSIDLLLDGFRSRDRASGNNRNRNRTKPHQYETPFPRINMVRRFDNRPENRNPGVRVGFTGIRARGKLEDSL
jgi:hypothetical protein